MYTSAYKAKNNIISTINRYYQINGDTDCFNNNAGNCITSINGTLKNMGYHVKGNLNDYCKKKSVLNKVNKIVEYLDIQDIIKENRENKNIREVPDIKDDINLDYLMKEDCLLEYPNDSFDGFLDFLIEAVENKDVSEIYILHYIELEMIQNYLIFYGKEYWMENQ